MKSGIKLKAVFGKLTAVLLIMLAMTQMLLVSPFSVGAVKIDEPLDITVNKGTYYEYQKENQGVSYGKSDISGIVNAFENVTEAEVNGEKGYHTQRGGFVEYSFNAPESALYNLYLTYAYDISSKKSSDMDISFSVNGIIPFAEASSCTLRRVWQDDGEIRADKLGNDLIPDQSQVSIITECGISDYSGYMTKPFALRLSKGENKIKITSLSGDLIIVGATLKPEAELLSYSELKKEYQKSGYKKLGNKIFDIYQAEKTEYKSSQIIYPVYDRSNSATQPSSPSHIKRNIIGGSNWSESGSWVSYKINTEKEGLYAITFKFRKNANMGMASFRNIYINGEIPCKEFANVNFNYSSVWQNKTITDKNGSPCLIYLKKGENTIKLEATLNSFSDIMLAVDDVNKQMNSLYRRIIMVTSTNPDLYRDYYLEREIPELLETLKTLSKTLDALADDFDKANGEKSSHSESLRRVSEQLEEFYKDTDEIPSRLANYRNNISILSDWLVTTKAQPLEMDYFIVHSEDYKAPSAKGGFWTNIIFFFKRFFASFASDYNSMSEYGDSNEVVEVWINDGRDQAQVLKNLIMKFTDETGIPVNVNLVAGGLTEAILAGNNPDIAVGVSRGQPVNLASRNALEDLSGYKGFSDIKNRFTSDALLPYSWKNGIYALPITQTYLVMFYRTDILNELNVSVPNTWIELLDTASMLQRNNMKIGLPYTAITAAGAVDLGVGAKDIFPTLLLQHGGDYYNEDMTGTALNSDAALEAFKLWCSFYTDYSFELSYDFNTRFRTGEMPIAIGSYGMYGILSSAAPEIRGLWKMALVPGVERQDGSIDRAGGASGSAVVMFKNAGNKKNCFSFMDWLTSAETQSTYGNDIENLLGPAARHATANLEAFSLLNWTDDELKVLEAQRNYVKEIPELPGGYYTSRCIDNAFRAVVYQNRNERISLEEAYKTINREIERKHIELE